MGSGIHCLDFRSVVAVDNRATYFQGVCKLAGLHCEFIGEQGELLDLLERGKTLLKCLYAAADQIAHLCVLE